MKSEPSFELIFLVFRVSDARVGVLSAAVDKVRSDPSSEDHLDGKQASRLIGLLEERGTNPLPIRVRGALHVASVPCEQVVPLPPLCATAQSFVTGVALSEESVRFLVIDPYRLAKSAAFTALPLATAGEQEFR